ncbi:MAG: DUF1573 domain-containing protein [Prevotella sp.]
MKKRTTIFAILTAVALHSMGQGIEVQNSSIDCGQVMFQVPVVAEYELRNTAKSPFTIVDVRTSCGCTSVDYPHKAIESGENFKLRVTYDAKQMGHFNKRVALYGNAEKTPVVLTLKGIVVEEVVDYVGDYPFMLGNLMADADNIEFDDVNEGDILHQSFHVKNCTEQPVQPVVMHLPDYLSADVSPSKIMPGRSGLITVSLDSRKLHDYGLTQTTVYLGQFPGDKVGANKEIPVSAVLLPAFPASDKAVAAPQLQLSAKSLDLGSFNGKNKLKGEIMLQNTGKAELEISNLQMFTTGLQVSLNKTRLAPGEVARIKVTAHARELKAARSKPRILMITNDPQNAKVVISIQTKE